MQATQSAALPAASTALQPRNKHKRAPVTLHLRLSKKDYKDIVALRKTLEVSIKDSNGVVLASQTVTLK